MLQFVLPAGLPTLLPTLLSALLPPMQATRLQALLPAGLHVPRPALQQLPGYGAMAPLPVLRAVA